MRMSMLAEPSEMPVNSLARFDAAENFGPAIPHHAFASARPVSLRVGLALRWLKAKAWGSLAAPRSVLHAPRVCLSIAKAALRKPLMSDSATMPATQSAKRKMSMLEAALRAAVLRL